MLHLDLYNVLIGKGSGCYSEHLFVLIMKADCANMFKLRKVYPEHVAVWEEYRIRGQDWLRDFYGVRQ